MLLGTEIGAALTALEPLGIDVHRAELRDRPGRDERAPAPPVPARPDRPVLHAQRRAADAGQGRRVLPAHARAARRRARPLHQGLRPRPGRRLLRHHARAPAPGRRAGRRAAGSPPAGPAPRPASRRSTSTCRSGRTRRTCRSASAPTPTARRRSARRCSSERWDDCVEIARDQTRDGAHLLDVCIDYVGRDGVADMKAIASRFATASTLPLVLDSTEPAVIEAGLELLGGRSVVNSVNYEDGDGPGSRFARDHADRAGARRRRRRAEHRRGGPGPHRRVEGARRRPG